MTLGPVMLDIDGHALTPQDREVIAHPQTGGVILFARNFASREQLEALVADIHAVKSPKVLVAVDQEGGRVQRFKAPFTLLPPLRALGRMYDIDSAAGLTLARDCGWLMASEMRSVGIDMSFAPVVDLDYGVSEIIGNRSLHHEPDHVATLARAYVGGMHEAGMAATAKHFPGHGAVLADSHLALPVDRRSADHLQADLLPYRRLIGGELAAVMTAHVVYPAIDERPASFSRRWVEGVLRKRLRFRGAVFCDDLSMAGAAVIGTVPERAHAALAAGCDMLPVCNDRGAAGAVLDALSAYENPLAQLRLVRLHGRPNAPTLEELRSDQRHKETLVALRRLDRTDELTLDG